MGSFESINLATDLIPPVVRSDHSGKVVDQEEPPPEGRFAQERRVAREKLVHLVPAIAA